MTTKEMKKKHNCKKLEHADFQRMGFSEEVIAANYDDQSADYYSWENPETGELFIAEVLNGTLTDFWDWPSFKYWFSEIPC